MSDFIGIWRFKGPPPDHRELQRLAQGLNGRSIGMPRFWHDDAMGFVHRQHDFTMQDRHERMPMAGPSGLVITGDLRLGNRDGLFASLGYSAAGPQETDGALLLRAMERWGIEETIPRLSGNFTFAVWDSSSRRLFLARDTGGGSALFFHHSPDLIAFSTRMRPLLGIAEIPRDLDERVIADYMALNLGSAERTLYQGIDRLPTGHMAVLSQNDMRLWPHWSPPQPGSLRLPRESDYVDQGHEILGQVVTDCLRARTPVTALLTGGLDSSAVATTAARLVAPSPLLTLTRQPDLPLPSDTTYHFFDETEGARSTAALHPTMDWHVVGGDEDDWGERDLRRIFLEAGLPLRNPTTPEFFFPVFRFMAKRGSNVCLSGDFGNGFFSQSGDILLPELLRRFRLRALFTAIRAKCRVDGMGFFAQTKRNVLRPFEPLAWRRWRRGEPALPWAGHAAINPAFAAELDLARRLGKSDYRVRVQGGSSSAMAERRWYLHDEVARDNISAFRALSGINLRVPLADRRILDFFGAVPLEQFLNNGVTRSLTRRMLAGAVSAETLSSRRRGMQAGDWFARATQRRPAMMAELLRLRASPLARRIVDLDRLQGLLDHWPSDADEAQARKSEYSSMLGRGLVMARFLAWHEGANG